MKDRGFTSFFVILSVALPMALLSGCGHKAPPLKPKHRVPQPAVIEEIAGRAHEVKISFRLPSKYLKGAKIKRDLGYKVERCLVGECKKVAKGKASPGSLVVVRDRGASQGMLYQYRVEVWGRHKAPPQDETFHYGPPPEPPEEVVATAKEGEVVLTWKTPTPGLGFRIYKAEDDKPFSLINRQPLFETRYSDTNVVNGETYSYKLRSVAKVEGGLLESEPSQVVKATPVDTTPPAIPESLSGAVLNGVVHLAWAPNTEPDLAGYRVYRREGRGKKVLLTPTPLTAPVFKDSEVKLRHRYLYYVTAVDKSGNESPAAVFRIRIKKEE